MRGATFQVERGGLFGIIGPNGAGKTTTLKMLAGLLAPSEGSAHVAGLDVRDPRHRARVGYLPEESALYEEMAPRAYLRFFAELYGVPRGLAKRRIEDLRDGLALGPEARDRNRAHLLYATSFLLLLAGSTLLPVTPVNLVARLAAGSADAGAYLWVGASCAGAVAAWLVLRAWLQRRGTPGLAG